MGGWSGGYSEEGEEEEGKEEEEERGGGLKLALVDAVEVYLAEGLVPLATDAALLAAWVPAKAPVMGSRPQGVGIGADREWVRRVSRVSRARRVEGRGGMVAGW